MVGVIFTDSAQMIRRMRFRVAVNMLLRLSVHGFDLSLLAAEGRFSFSPIGSTKISVKLSNRQDTMQDIQTIILWRPVGPKELDLIRQAKMRAFPPRLPDQPIFYPVLSEDYAIKIARDWNVPASGSGYVTRFAVRRDFLAAYEVQKAGGRAHLEYWIPAGDLLAFNSALVGEIEVTHSFA
jgi:hypothetical protein